MGSRKKRWTIPTITPKRNIFWINYQTQAKKTSLYQKQSIPSIHLLNCVSLKVVFNFRKSFLSYTSISLSAFIIAFVVQIITIPLLSLLCVRACFCCSSSPLMLVFFLFVVISLGASLRDSVYLHVPSSLLLFYSRWIPGGNFFLGFLFISQVQRGLTLLLLLRTQRVWACSHQLMLIFPRAPRIPLSQDTLGMNACGCLLGTLLQ